MGNVCNGWKWFFKNNHWWQGCSCCANCTVNSNVIMHLSSQSFSSSTLFGHDWKMLLWPQKEFRAFFSFYFLFYKVAKRFSFYVSSTYISIAVSQPKWPQSMTSKDREMSDFYRGHRRNRKVVNFFTATFLSISSDWLSYMWSFKFLEWASM